MANKLFNSVKVSAPDANTFDLTHDVKMTMQMGNLVPILAMECLPGDKFTIGSESLIRLAPLLAPVYQRMDVYTHYFFVPNRILWKNWEKFITDASTDLVLPFFPYAAGTSADAFKFLDYFGVPPIDPANPQLYKLNAFPFAAYQAIYNEYYRDQNLIAPIDYQLIDGEQTGGQFIQMRRRAWEHDYFTSALPFAQKGAAVDIPLGAVQGQSSVKTNTAGGVTLTATPTNQNVPYESGAIPFPNSLFVDIDADVEPTTINDLRRAFKLQEWLEKNARGGTRYVESILVHFGVRSSDARLQRPEYITGSKSPIVISEVLNTTGTTGELPQGNMAGHGISVAGGNQSTFFCEEHGYIIGIMSIMPKATYSQGIPKHFLKAHPLDYYWPSFANIGEQSIVNVEINIDNEGPDETFGYTPRYAEYRYLQNRIAGDFRTTLDYWTLSRQFIGNVPLNQNFIEVHPEDTLRIFAVQDGTDPIYCQVVNHISARRKMPIYGTPTF